MRIRPDRTTRYSTHITGGPSERYAREARKDAVGPPVNDEEVTSDDKSTSSLVKNGVFQRRDFEVRIEYDDRDGAHR